MLQHHISIDFQAFQDLLDTFFQLIVGGKMTVDAVVMATTRMKVMIVSCVFWGIWNQDKLIRQGQQQFLGKATVDRGIVVVVVVGLLKVVIGIDTVVHRIQQRKQFLAFIVRHHFSGPTDFHRVV